MTFEEALELFGLRRIPSEAVLKVLRNDAVKEAIEAKDEDRQKEIHRAFAVLIGKKIRIIRKSHGCCTKKKPTIIIAITIIKLAYSNMSGSILGSAPAEC